MLSCLPDTTPTQAPPHLSCSDLLLLSLPSPPLHSSHGNLVGRAQVVSRQYQHFMSTWQCCCSAWKGTSEHFLLFMAFPAFFRSGLNQEGGQNWYSVPSRAVWEGPGTRHGGASTVEAALSIVSDALQESWCQLTLAIAERSCKAAGVTPPEDMALIRRMPKRLICLLSGAWLSSRPQPPWRGWVLV